MAAPVTDPHTTTPVADGRVIVRELTTGEQRVYGLGNSAWLVAPDTLLVHRQSAEGGGEAAAININSGEETVFEEDDIPFESLVEPPLTPWGGRIKFVPHDIDPHFRDPHDTVFIPSQ